MYLVQESLVSSVPLSVSVLYLHVYILFLCLYLSSVVCLSKISFLSPVSVFFLKFSFPLLIIKAKKTITILMKWVECNVVKYKHEKYYIIKEKIYICNWSFPKSYSKDCVLIYMIINTQKSWSHIWGIHFYLTLHPITSKFPSF